MTGSGGDDPTAGAMPRALVLLELLEALGRRAEVAGRLEPPGGQAVLRSVVDATVTLFDAEAASIALHDGTTDRLTYVVAAGAQGQGVVGLSVAPHEGVAGYVFSTGQPLAIADATADPRFGSATAERTGYIPRSLLAVPLVDDDTSLGVLTILDKRSGEGFGLRDVELAGVFARQAATAIRATRIERDTAGILRDALASIAADDAAPDGIDALVSRTVARIVADGDDGLWLLADRVARLRDADPDQVALLGELLDVLVRRSDSRRAGRGGSRSGRSGRADR